MALPAAGPRGESVNKTVTSILLTGLLITVCALSGGTSPLRIAAAEEVEREELGKTIQSIPPSGPPEHYGNVILRKKSKKAGMPPVIFPHWVHRARYTCRVCHFELQFSTRRDDTGITRAAYLAGQYCGACHNGKTAFSARDEQPRHCDRCHLKSLEGLDARFEAFAGKMPGSSFGNGIDWAAALNDGIINPAASLSADYTPMPLPDNLKRTLKLGTTSPNSDVTFSHEEHYAELDCSNCHPDVFNIKKKGTEAFSMDRNLYGRYCGTCHMRVAFPMNDCHHCHPKIKSSFGR